MLIMKDHFRVQVYRPAGTNSTAKLPVLFWIYVRVDAEALTFVLTSIIGWAMDLRVCFLIIPRSDQGFYFNAISAASEYDPTSELTDMIRVF